MGNALSSSASAAAAPARGANVPFSVAVRNLTLVREHVDDCTRVIDHAGRREQRHGPGCTVTMNTRPDAPPVMIVPHPEERVCAAIHFPPGSGYVIACFTEAGWCNFYVDDRDPAAAATGPAVAAAEESEGGAEGGQRQRVVRVRAFTVPRTGDPYSPAKNALECSLCATRARDQVLDCGHTMCLECFTRLQRAHPGDALRCPFCRARVSGARQIYFA